MLTTHPMTPEVRFILTRCGEDGIRTARKRTYFSCPFPSDGMDCPSFWDGGTIAYWTFIKLSTGASIQMPSNHPMFEAGRPYHVNHLPDDCLLVKTGIFCGKVATAVLYYKDLTQLEVLK